MCTSSLYGNASSISNDIFGEIVLKYLLGFSKVHSIIKGNQKIELSPAPAPPAAPPPNVVFRLIGWDTGG